MYGFNFILSAFKYESTVKKIHSQNIKAVQLITARFHYNNWMFKDLGIEPFKNCPENRCFAFRSSNLLHLPEESADAVVVHAPNLWYTPSKNYKRKPKQLWMYYTMEPQRLSHCSSHYQLADLDNWFNLTATFKKDSDIVLDYKTFRNWSQIEHESIFVNEYKARRQKKNLIQAIQDLSSKSKKASVVWFVSHCETNSKREDYVKELMKYVNVDVFGKCSKNFHHTENKEPCNASPDGDCFKKFMNGYKFRLAFENSLCTDYITEKFWSMYNPEFIFDVHSVPIVRGARDYQYKKDVPFENFYLNTQNFKSPKELADYLNYLDANQTAYLEFFKWKVDLFKKIEENLKNFKISKALKRWPESFLLKEPFCKLCEYLHNDEYLNNYAQNRRWKLSEWFDSSKDCWDENENYFKMKAVNLIGFCI
ncbi:alpha-(1-3)-fucosyltransferase C-like [Brachionus plicatilis]|uniref:Fucosyltransferase n=1 Tax=Brachionus plicatilis TaxID=10195 RepID=A0A3M7RH15_BRAPC|nr:alpha-(1-3)-fucosyltransferase C-like [Brachionus plicatilis]